MNISKTNLKTVLLLIIVVMPLLLPVGFLLKRFAIQVQMQVELKRAGTQKFTLLLDKIHWIKKDKEILLEGKFFDLKSFRIINDSIEVTGIFDKAEDELNEKLSKVIQHRQEGNSQLNSLAFLLIFNTTIHQFPDYFPALFLESFHKKKQSPDENIIKQYSPVSTPPPNA